MKTMSRIFLGVTLSLLAFNVVAGSSAEIKERMKARQGELRELKTQGIIKESTSGYLEFIPGKNQEKKAVVDAENKDRKSVYTAIAKQQGTTIDNVAKLRGKTLTQSK